MSEILFLSFFHVCINTFLNPDDEVYRIDKVLFYYRIKDLSRTLSANTHSMDLTCQIIENHPTVYRNVMGMALCALRENSTSYKVGRALTFIFRQAKDLVNNHFRH